MALIKPNATGDKDNLNYIKGANDDDNTCTYINETVL